MNISIDCVTDINYDDYPEFHPDELELNKEGWIKSGGDTNRNPNFNKLLYNLFPKGNRLNIMDIGCGGGTFIEDCIKDGHLGIGIDCTPVYEEWGLGSWPKYPNNFFRCNVARPFYINYDGWPVSFDVITSWECLEHIHPKHIPNLINCIGFHLKKGGVFIGSASLNADRVHRTCKDKNWWLEQFAQCDYGSFKEMNVNFRHNVIRWLPESSIYLYLQKEQ